MIPNQDVRLVQVKTPNMTSKKTVSNMFLGKNGLDLLNGEYVNKEEVEFEVVMRKNQQLKNQMTLK